MRRVLAALAIMAATAGQGLAVPCGGSFPAFVAGLKAEAVAAGHDAARVDAFFRGVAQDARVLRADRSQGVFQKTFTEFSRSLISQNRINNAAANARKHARLFDRAEREFGVSRGILLAFWAFETDFGAFQGDYNTLNALVTLAHDCRRPALFRPQVLAALALSERGMFDPATTTGAWAGEIGMVQMLPADILKRGVDGDGDGKVSLKTSVPDAILSGANMLRSLGWRAGEPWLQEVTVPADLDWARTGIDKSYPVSDWAARGVKPRAGALPAGSKPASLLLPQGRKGPAFLVYPNFSVLFEWNKSFVYVTTAAYFAARIEGAPVFAAGNPDPALSQDQMKALQTRLKARGHDVGGIDGILGAMTRIAVQKEQARLGLPADAWPTRALLDRL
jgi:lytic murein transglycosylase